MTERFGSEPKIFLEKMDTPAIFFTRLLEMVFFTKRLIDSSIWKYYSSASLGGLVCWQISHIFAGCTRLIFHQTNKIPTFTWNVTNKNSRGDLCSSSYIHRYLSTHSRKATISHHQPVCTPPVRPRATVYQMVAIHHQFLESELSSIRLNVLHWLANRTAPVPINHQHPRTPGAGKCAHAPGNPICSRRFMVDIHGAVHNSTSLCSTRIWAHRRRDWLRNWGSKRWACRRTEMRKKTNARRLISTDSAATRDGYVAQKRPSIGMWHTLQLLFTSSDSSDHFFRLSSTIKTH